MSFKCDSCRVAQRTGAKPRRVVSETRTREYKDKSGDVRSTGWEIVQEVNLCGACASLISES